MSEVTAERPTLATSHYAPEGYTATVNSMLNYPWPEGTGQDDVNESERAVMRAVIEIADAYIAGDATAAARLVADRLAGLSHDWSPLRYFQVTAEAMACPVWAEYTDEQRQRGYVYAARYVRARLVEWLRPPHRHSPDAEAPQEPFRLSELPRAAQVAFTEQFAGKAEYRRGLAQVMAYLATHPDEEFVPGQLREITRNWTTGEPSKVFF